MGNLAISQFYLMILHEDNYEISSEGCKGRNHNSKLLYTVFDIINLHLYKGTCIFM